MKWRGMDNATPTSDVPGAMTLVKNARMSVEGEMRRRRGTARTSLAQASGPITAIADFALSPNNPYALTLVSDAINGDQGISSQWGDAALTAVSGTSISGGTTAYTLNVSRGTSQFATSAIIYANAGTYPTDATLGTYVGEVAMDPWSTSATTSWTAPELGAWYFRVYPVRDRLIGPGANMTPVDTGSFTITDTLSFSILQLVPSVSINCTVAGIPGTYITGNGGANPTVSLGTAIFAGAVTLPLSLTMTPGANGVGPPGVLIQVNNNWTAGNSFVAATVTNGVVCGNVTCSSPRTIGLTP